MGTLTLFLTGAVFIAWVLPAWTDSVYNKIYSPSVSIQEKNNSINPVYKNGTQFINWKSSEEKNSLKKKKVIPMIFDAIPIYTSPSPILPAFDIIKLDQKNTQKRIYRYWKEYEPITYAWEKWKDIDFILMIQEESLWDEIAVGDEGASIWYCQINKYYGEEEYNKYVSMNNWKKRINFCYEHYQRHWFSVWEVFHGWNSRKRNLKSFTFK